MPWYPDDYDDPSEQDNSWDETFNEYNYEEELTFPSYSPDNPLAGYDPDRMWGGSDLISITAMWAGDLSAEMYCYDKSFRLGGFPWDEGVHVHPSYHGVPGKAGMGNNELVWFFLAAGVLAVITFICSVT